MLVLASLRVRSLSLFLALRSSLPKRNMTTIQQSAAAASVAGNIDTKSNQKPPSKVDAQRYISPHLRGSVIDSKQPAAATHPSATRKRTLNVNNITPDHFVKLDAAELSELQLYTVKPGDGILDMGGQNGTLVRANGLYQTPLHLCSDVTESDKDIPKARVIATTMCESKTVVTGLTLDAVAMIRLATHAPDALAPIRKAKTVCFSGDIHIVQPPLLSVEKNVAAHQALGKHHNGVNIQLFPVVNQFTNLEKSSFSAHLSMHFNALGDQQKKNALLWLDSHDWIKPTGFFFPNYARGNDFDPSNEETFVEIVNETRFPFVVVIQRDNWIHDAKANKLLMTNYWIYCTSEIKNKEKETGKLSPYLLVAKH
jgi:hypothetical protein